MNFKSWLNTIRAPKRPDVNIIGISKDIMSDNTTSEQRQQINDFPINLMTKEEKIVLTKSLSTFNTKESTYDSASRFRYEMLDKLFTPEGSDDIMAKAYNTESKYKSDMIPYLIGQHCTNEIILNIVMNHSTLGNEHHRIGIVKNKNAPSESFRYAYKYILDNAADVDYRLDPLENIYLPIKTMAQNPSTPIDILSDITDDFGHMTGIFSSTSSAARKAIDDKFMPKLISTEDAKNELSLLGYNITPNTDKYSVTLTNMGTNKSTSISLSEKHIDGFDRLPDTFYRDSNINGLNKLPETTHRAASALLYNEYNTDLHHMIDVIHNSKKEVELILNDLNEEYVL